MAAVKLLGFLVLIAAIFACAHLVGGTVGPVTTVHSHIQYTGSTSGANMGGMNMGGQP